jgi:hypothetical protein
MLSGEAGDVVSAVEGAPAGCPPGGVGKELEAWPGAVVKFQTELTDIPSGFLARTTQ